MNFLAWVSFQVRLVTVLWGRYFKVFPKLMLSPDVVSKFPQIFDAEGEGDSLGGDAGCSIVVDAPCACL